MVPSGAERHQRPLGLGLGLGLGLVPSGTSAHSAKGLVPGEG